MTTTPAPTPEEILAILIPVLVGANSARYAGIAAFVVLSYDHFLTFGDEVRASTVVWSRKLKCARAGPIFLVWRVVDIANTVFPGECARQVH